MARPGLTQAQIWEAADALLAAGVTPTVQALRERLGKGSFTTISTHLAEWRQVHAERQAPEVPEPPEPVTFALRAVWASAWRSGQEAVAGEREALEKTRREMAGEQQAMGVEIQRLEGAMEALEKAREAMEGELASARETNSALAVEKARLEERVAALEREKQAAEQAQAGLRVELQARAESWEQQARERQGQVERLQEELVALAKKGPARPKGSPAGK